MSKLTIKWTVSDGYVGGGPQYTKIDSSEIEDCETVDEAMGVIEDIVQNDFLEKVCPALSERDKLRVEIQSILEKGAQP